MSEADLNRRIGRHRLTKALSSPDLLCTYEAVHDEAGPVHVRALEAEFMPSDRALERLTADATLASRIELEGATRLIDWSSEEPIHVSTTVVVGRRLAEVVEALPNKRLQPELVATLAVDLAHTLDEAHAAGLVHAGLSPQNVHLTPEGRARITDFAIARFLTSLLGGHSFVLSGMVRGLAPEQLAAPDTIGPATDVFALGVLLYRACTGAEPFEAPSAFGMSLRLTTATAEPIEKQGVELPAALAETIMAMLSAPMAERPTLREVCARLLPVAGSVEARRAELSRALIAAGGPAPERVEPPRPSPRAAPARENPPPAAVPAPTFVPFDQVDEGPTRIDTSLDGAEPDPKLPYASLGSLEDETTARIDDRHPTRVDHAPVMDFDPADLYEDDDDASGFGKVPVTEVLLQTPVGRAARPTAPMRAVEAPLAEPLPPAPLREPMDPLLIAAWVAITLVIGVIVAIGVYAATVT